MKQIIVLPRNHEEHAQQHRRKQELKGEQRKFPNPSALAIEPVGIDQRNARVDIGRQQAAEQEHDETNRNDDPDCLQRKERGNRSAEQLTDDVAPREDNHSHQ